MTLQKQHFYGFLCLLACIALAGCVGGDLGRALNDAFSGYEHVESLGAPDKNCSLVKYRSSGRYAIAIRGDRTRFIRLGAEYSRARVVKQFSDSGEDYAVIECGKEDGSLKNMLLAIPASARQAKFYPLGSASGKPFTTDTAQYPTRLLQDADSPGQIQVWYLDNAGVRGPALVSRAREKEQGSASSGGAGKTAARPARAQTAPAPQALPPAIEPLPSAQAEEEPARTSQPAQPPRASAPAKPAEQQGGAASPSPSPAPVIVLDKPPAASAPAAPVIILDMPPPEPKAAEKPAAQ